MSEGNAVCEARMKVLPAPMARLIGDLSDRERVLLGLDLVPQDG